MDILIIKFKTFGIMHNIEDWAFSGVLHNGCSEGQPLK